MCYINLLKSKSNELKPLKAMQNYLLQLDDEENFFNRFRKIIKEELSNNLPDNGDVDSQSTYIKVKEVCDLLGVTIPTIDSWCRSGYIKKYKIKSRTFFCKTEILEFLSKQGK